MLRKFTFFILVIFNIGLTQGFPQELDSLIIKGKGLIKEGFVRSNPEILSQGLSLLQKGLSQGRGSPLLRYYLGLTHYRFANVYLETANNKKVKSHLDKAISHLSTSIKRNKSDSDSHALLAACYGTKISTNPFLGMTLGPRSDKHFKIAEKLKPNNPRIYLLRGVGKYFTPKLFGGGKENALKDLEKASNLFNLEKRLDPVLPDWGRSELHAWMGKIYTEIHKFQEAEEHYRLALQMEPEFKWVKDELTPKLKAIVRTQ